MKLKPALIFGEHMIFQQNKEIRVWGTSAAGDRVTVTLGNESATVSVKEGAWEAILSPMEACFKTSLIISSEKTGEKITFNDVAIGEVWLAGGQSNMEFLMKFDYDFEETSKLPSDNDLRFICYPQTAFKGFLETENDCPDWGFWRKWDDIEDRKMFSAVATYAGMLLRKKLDVPVGIVGCNWGGTPAAAWTAKENLESNPKLKKILDWHKEACETTNWPIYIPASEQKAAPKDPVMEENFERMMMGEDMSEFFKNFDPSVFMSAPFVPFMPGPRSTVRPSGLYENMLTKVAPFGIRGALWYQGEDDDAREWGDIYDESMKTMITSWRKLWGYDFPFYQVELAPFEGVGPTGAKNYPQIRHQQAKAVSELKDAYDICILDAGEKINIHPRHKKIVGERLGRVVLKHTYGDESLVADCPVAKEASFDKGTVTITFENAAGGIVINGDLSSALKVTQEGNSVKYAATVEKDRLVITGLKENVPVKIEYCEENFCPAVLFNSEGNPVYGFTFELREV